jgi:hypothetical protein
MNLGRLLKSFLFLGALFFSIPTSYAEDSLQERIQKTSDQIINALRSRIPESQFAEWFKGWQPTDFIKLGYETYSPRLDDQNIHIMAEAAVIEISAARIYRRNADLENKHFVDDPELFFLNQNNYRPDGLMYHFVGDTLRIDKIVEAKRNLGKYRNFKIRDTLNYWAKFGIRVPEGYFKNVEIWRAEAWKTPDSIRDTELAKSVVLFGSRDTSSSGSVVRSGIEVIHVPLIQNQGKFIFESLQNIQMDRSELRQILFDQMEANFKISSHQITEEMWRTRLKDFIRKYARLPREDATDVYEKRLFQLFGRLDESVLTKGVNECKLIVEALHIQPRDPRINFSDKYSPASRAHKNR